MDFSSTIQNTRILAGFIVVLIFVLVYLIVRLKKSEKKKITIEAKYKELELKVNNLQLESLESKLNPHLFKNVLNTIQSHAYQTYFALDKLANVLDYILYKAVENLLHPKKKLNLHTV